MRFAGRVSAANYVTAGQIAAEQSSAFAQIARDNAPRYEEQVKESIKQDAAKYDTAVNAKTAFINAATNAAGTVSIANQKKEVFEADEKAKSSMRKAGILVKAGGLLGQGLAKTPEKPVRKVDTSILQNEVNRLNELEGKYKAEAEEASNYVYEGGESDDSTPTKSTPTTPIEKVAPSDYGMRLMTDLVKGGYSPTAAASIAGNAQYETDGFKAMEEYAPNAHGTKGLGVMMWTDSPSSSRRSEFVNWAKSQNLDPTSYQANLGYLQHEMKGGAHWTGGMNTNSFNQISDLTQSVNTFQDNYLRPNPDVQNTPQRLSNAQALLNAYNNR